MRLPYNIYRVNNTLKHFDGYGIRIPLAINLVLMAKIHLSSSGVHKRFPSGGYHRCFRVQNRINFYVRHNLRR